jgi:hypothetical protein
VTKDTTASSKSEYASAENSVYSTSAEDQDVATTSIVKCQEVIFDLIHPIIESTTP